MVTFKSYLTRSVAQRGANLAERINFAMSSQEGEVSLASLTKLWSEAAESDPSLFTERLTWDTQLSNDIQSACHSSGSVNSEFPQWTRVVDQVLWRLRSRASYSSSTHYTDPKTFFGPFIQIAIHMLERRSHFRPLLRRTSLRAALEIDISRVLQAFIPILERNLWTKEYHADKSANTTNIETSEPTSFSNATRSVYRLFESYPVLIRDLTLIVQNWAIHISEIIDRLHRDEMYLRNVAHMEVNLEKLLTIRTQLSDPHNSGRSVSLLSFRGGKYLIYKPRDIYVEFAWQHLIGWINSRSGLLGLSAAKAYPRGRYGWVEYVPAFACHDSAQVKRYYCRIGYLLGLLYFLGTYDIHYENLLSSGEHPIIVDLETIITPSIDGNNHNLELQGLARYQTIFNDSVIRTGLLPIPNHHDTTIGNTAALSLSSSRYRKFDESSSIRGSISHSSLPVLKGRQVGPGKYVELICTAFKDMYEVITSNAKSLLSQDGPMTHFENASLRYVCRPTRIYTAILERSRCTSCLHDGLTRSIFLDALLVSHSLKAQVNPSLLHLIKYETQALENQDIPVFETSYSTDCLKIPNGKTLHRFFKDSGRDMLKRRLTSASDKDRRLQEIIIRYSLNVEPSKDVRR